MPLPSRIPPCRKPACAQALLISTHGALCSADEPAFDAELAFEPPTGLSVRWRSVTNGVGCRGDASACFCAGRACSLGAGAPTVATCGVVLAAGETLVRAKS